MKLHGIGQVIISANFGRERGGDDTLLSFSEYPQVLLSAGQAGITLTTDCDYTVGATTRHVHIQEWQVLL